MGRMGLTPLKSAETRTGGCFRIRECIEYLVDLVCVVDGHLDRMRRKFSIKGEGALKMVRNELGICLPLRKDPMGVEYKDWDFDKAYLSEEGCD
jgi:hypothetical protein